MRMGPLVALVTALSALGGGAAAQVGPSFDCDDATTLTEHAICGSSRLSSLERALVRSYEGLVARIGEREARRIADGLLVERQACEGDVACIQTMLTVSAGVFESVGAVPSTSLSDAIRAARALREGGGSPLAGREPPAPGLQDLIARERAAREAAAAPAPPPAEIEETPVRAALPPAAPPADRAATAGSPLARAFAALPADERLTVERHLTDAGLPSAEADGAWSDATETALGAVVRATGEDGSPLDVSDVPGAAVLLDFVASDAFRAAQSDAERPLDFQW